MKKWLKIILPILLVLVVVRLVLPFVVLHYANKRLAEISGYHGHIRDIDLALIRGAYKINDIYLNKINKDKKTETPMFSADLIDLSVEWKALFHGSIVGELVFEKPVLRFTKDKVEPKHLRNDSSSFKKLLDDFMPLKINRFEIKDGNLEYKDEFSKPKVDVRLTQLHVLALNLKNSYDSATLLPATVNAEAKVYEGHLKFGMKINPLKDKPTFDLNAELKDTNLVLLNDFFQAYAKIDVNKGKFGMYTEVAAKNGKFTGYVKPLVQNLDVLGKEDRKDNLLRKLWEGLVGAVGQVFKNQPKDQVATKIPLQGSLNQPNADLWTTVLNVLENAFVQAIQPSIDNEININSVSEHKPKKKPLLKRIFG
ncbi:MAG TPA: DUF748 domain-containing protein [Cyclobacteriaceae bacterium]